MLQRNPGVHTSGSASQQNAFFRAGLGGFCFQNISFSPRKDGTSPAAVLSSEREAAWCYWLFSTVPSEDLWSWLCAPAGGSLGDIVSSWSVLF